MSDQEEKGPLDSLFERAEKFIGQLVKDEESKEPSGVIDAEFTEDPTPVEVPDKIHTAPTVPERALLLGRVMPSGYWHLFIHMGTTAVCGAIFEPHNIVVRRRLDKEATYHFVCCMGCVARAILIMQEMKQLGAGDKP